MDEGGTVREVVAAAGNAGFQVVLRPSGTVQQWYSEPKYYIDLERCIHVDGDGTPQYDMVRFPKVVINACMRRFPSVASTASEMVQFLSTTICMGNRVIADNQSAYSHKYRNLFDGSISVFQVSLAICSKTFLVKFVRIESLDFGMAMSLCPKSTDSKMMEDLDCVQTKEWVMY